MNKKQFRGMALPLTVCALSILSVRADNLEEVIVTASPHGKRSGEVAGAVSLLDGKALQTAVAATLGETLQNQPGMANGSFGPGVGLPVIRGLSGKRVEILQNGTGVADASASSPDHAIGTEPLLADR